MMMHIERVQHALKFVLEPLVPLHIIFGQVKQDPAIAIVAHPVVGIGEIP